MSPRRHWCHPGARTTRFYFPYLFDMSGVYPKIPSRPNLPTLPKIPFHFGFKNYPLRDLIMMKVTKALWVWAFGQWTRWAIWLKIGLINYSNNAPHASTLALTMNLVLSLALNTFTMAWYKHKAFTAVQVKVANMKKWTKPASTWHGTCGDQMIIIFLHGHNGSYRGKGWISEKNPTIVIMSLLRFQSSV